jgi:hypothetical protein
VIGPHAKPLLDRDFIAILRAVGILAVLRAGGHPLSVDGHEKNLQVVKELPGCERSLGQISSLQRSRGAAKAKR